MMRQLLDITFVRICVMRRNYNSKFNELTPIGWVVVVGTIILIAVAVSIVVIMFINRS